jgi:hypothetical protein
LDTPVRAGIADLMQGTAQTTFIIPIKTAF